MDVLGMFMDLFGMFMDVLGTFFVGIMNFTRCVPSLPFSASGFDLMFFVPKVCNAALQGRGKASIGFGERVGHGPKTGHFCGRMILSHSEMGKSRLPPNNPRFPPVTEAQFHSVSPFQTSFSPIGPMMPWLSGYPPAKPGRTTVEAAKSGSQGMELELFSPVFFVRKTSKNPVDETSMGRFWLFFFESAEDVSLHCGWFLLLGVKAVVATVNMIKPHCDILQKS